MDNLAQKAKVNWDSCQYSDQAMGWMLQKWGSFPKGAEDFLIFTKVRQTLGPTQPSEQPALKLVQVGHSCAAKVKNAWSCNSVPSCCHSTVLN